jgi:UDP-GlcNAc:undecaprenyl-phosphate GlcNAc-1-phosphate transferase
MHSKPTPRIGGLAMFIGFVVSVSIAAPIGWFEVVFADPGPIIAISLAALVVMAIGFLDDLIDLDWTIKLAGQFLAAGVLAWNGVQIVSLPIFGITVGSFGVSFVVTVFLAVLVMNAVNFIDGLDGLVAGVVLIGTVVFFIYSYLLAQQISPTNYFNLATVISAIVIGMCIGFLPHNWHTAKIFMGDGGSYFLGFSLAAISIVGPAKGLTSVSLLLPLLILSLPLADMSAVIMGRLSEGRSPFYPDRRHLHHRLLRTGLSHRHTVLLIYAFTQWLAALALVLVNAEMRFLWLALATAVLIWVLVSTRRRLQRVDES